jgi:hypothetical protein
MTEGETVDAIGTDGPARAQLEPTRMKVFCLQWISQAQSYEKRTLASCNKVIIPGESDDCGGEERLEVVWVCLVLDGFSNVVDAMWNHWKTLKMRPNGGLMGLLRAIRGYYVGPVF